MKINYSDINSLPIGGKYVLDNKIGIVKDVEKTKVVAEILEIVDDKQVKVKINSSLLKQEVEAVIDFYLLK